MKSRLIYLLHSGQMFGTERMALATLGALSPHFEGYVLAPGGPVHAAARECGLISERINTPLQMAGAMFKQLIRRPDTAVMSTSVAQAFVASALQKITGGTGAHVHVVHGGTDELRSYGRKRFLSGLNVQFVAVSDFVQQRLVEHGVRANQITVIPNFLHSPPPAQRAPFTRDGVRRVVVLSRLDRIKRLGLLFDALDKVSGLGQLQIDIFGSGEEAQTLQHRAQRWPHVHLHGFVPDASSTLGQADLLVHTCPEEPFGLVMLEAFAAGVPVLVPNAGGASCIVRDGVNGFHFSANSPMSLGRKLIELMRAPSDLLNAMAQGGRQALSTEFRADNPARRYAELLGVRS